MPFVVHDTERYANNRAEVSHEPIRQSERQMPAFKSVAQAQRFWSVHGVIQNLFESDATCCGQSPSHAYGSDERDHSSGDSNRWLQ
jgi:transposase-like protein